MIDAGGNVIVAGYGGAGLVVRKYDPTLTTLLGSNGYAGVGVRGAAIDGSGNIVLVGSEPGSGGGFDYDWRIVKFNASLSAVIATTVYDGPGHSMDKATAVAIDGSGNVVVAGFETYMGSRNWRIWIYDSGLTSVLSTTVYYGGGASAWGVAVDPSGNIAVVGDNDEFFMSDRWHIRTYDSILSTLLGQATPLGPTLGGYDFASCAVFDGSGNIVVGGVQDDLTGWQNWRIRKYNLALTSLLATTGYDGPGHQDDGLESVAVDGCGNVIAVGFERTATGDYSMNWRIRKYDSALSTLLATTDFNGSGNDQDVPWGVAVDGTGKVVVAGSESTGVCATKWRIRAYDGCVIPPLRLASSLAVSTASLCGGAPFLATMEVVNTGTSAVTNVSATIWQSGGGGSADWTGPEPASVANLAAGSTVTFTWTVTPVSPGTIVFSGTAAGDGVTSNLAVVNASSSGPPWTGRTANPLPRMGPAAIGMTGTLYVAGGYDGSYLTRIDTYHPDFGTWSKAGDMPTGRYGLGVVQFGGQLFFIGGATLGGPSGVNEMWDPVANTWWTRSPMPTARYAPGVAAVGGNAYVIGGDGGAAALSKVEGYSLMFDGWSTLAPMPTPRYELAASALNGIIYAVGGTNGGGPMAVVEAYDPATNTWSTKASMHVARSALGVAVVGGTLYAVGGDNAGNVTTVEAYDPATNSWTLLCGLTTGRSSVAVADVGATVYAVGGWNAGFLASVEAAVVPRGPAEPQLYVSKVGDKGSGPCGTVVTWDTTIAYPPIEDSLFRCGDDQPASSVALTDAIPAGMTYVPGSLQLSTDNGSSFGLLTDGTGDDAGEVVAGVVTVRLGTLTEGDGDWNCNLAAARIVRFSTSHTGGWAGLVSNTAFVDYQDAAGSARPRAMSSADFTGAGCPVPVLDASLSSPCGTVVAGQLFLLTMTVTNTGAGPADLLRAQVWRSAGPGSAAAVGPSPGSVASLAPGGSVVFTWTATAGASGSMTWSGTSTGSGIASAAVSTCAMTVQSAAALVAWMDAPAVVPMGAVFTATVYVANTTSPGGLSTTVTGIARGTIEAPPGTVGAPGALGLPLPFVVGAMTTTAFAWTTTALACGSAILTVTVTGAEAGTGRVLGPVVLGRRVTVSGVPARVEIAAAAAEVTAGSAVTLTVTVFDACGAGNPVAFAPVSLFVIAGGGSVTPVSGSTNIWGRLVVTLTTGTAGGANGVRADVPAGTWPSGTVYVTATLPPPPPPGPPLLTTPGAATDKNVFEPSRGDIVLARIYPLDDSGIYVRIYTASGRLVRTLRVLESAGSGQYVVRWDGRSDDEFIVARGVYLIHVQGGGLNQVLKVVVR